MKKLHWICGLSLCSAALLTSCNQNQVDASKSGDDQDGDGTQYVQPVIWTGPGWYYGIWFSTEIDFNNWNHHHYHNYDRNHDHHSDHHDRHRDGGVDKRGRDARSRDSSGSRPHANGARSQGGGARPHGGGGGGGHHEKGGRK